MADSRSSTMIPAITLTQHYNHFIVHFFYKLTTFTETALQFNATLFSDQNLNNN